jgi:hypothetical protein
VTEVTDALTRFGIFTKPRDGPGGNPFKLSCSLDRPATREEIRSAWPAMSLPTELTDAWSVSREARLFVDVDYGQWGLVLLSPAASARRTAQERTQRPADYRADDVVIGEFLGDLDLLVISPSEPGDRRILVSLPLDDRDHWYGVASSLAEFLRRYLESRGDKYWKPSV